MVTTSGGLYTPIKIEITKLPEADEEVNQKEDSCNCTNCDHEKIIENLKRQIEQLKHIVITLTEDL